jgi:hypothetical protein
MTMILTAFIALEPDDNHSRNWWVCFDLVCALTTSAGERGSQSVRGSCSVR